MSYFLLIMGEGMQSTAQITQVREALPEGVTLIVGDNKEKLEPYFAETVAVAGWIRTVWLLEMPKLEWAQQWWVGTDWLARFPSLIEHPFRLTNMGGTSATQMTEHIFAMMLTHVRNLRHAIEAQNAGVWSRLYHPQDADKHIDQPFSQPWTRFDELGGKTLLILGAGGIGARTAKIGDAFDMHVIGIRNNPSKSLPYVSEMFGMDQLHAVLPRADFIVIILPFTEATKNLIGKAEFDLMKPSAYFINVGRGGIVDEDALLDALRTGSISGAASDVFEEEPLPEDSPLWHEKNLLITSHYGGASIRHEERAFPIFLENIGRWQRGEEMLRLVDKVKGY